MIYSSIRAIACVAPFLLLPACNGSKPAGGGTVAMHDMAVVDGTANDSMVDLDNATQDGTALSNAGGLPGAMPMPAAQHSAAAPAADNAAAPAGDKISNSSASQ